MGLKRGLFIGLLAGAAAAAMMKAKRAEAPSSTASAELERETAGEAASSADLRNTLDRIKHHAEEAIEAAHQAQEEKAAELNRQFEDAKRGAKTR